MENELSLINEDLGLLLQKLLAVLLHLFGHGGTEHHNLLVMGSLHKNVLNVGSHLGVAENLVAFVNNEELALDQSIFLPSRRRSTCGGLNHTTFRGLQ